MGNKNPVNFEIIKIKNICSSKDIIKKMNRQATAWKKIFKMHFSQINCIKNIESTPKNQ